MADVALFADGKIYRGWQSVSVSRAVDIVAGSFSVSMTERLRRSSAPLKIRPGQSVQVQFDGQSVITGFIDSVDVSYNERQHSIIVAGRDKTADLVDCSAPSKQFNNQSLKDIAATLCAPFGINVIGNAPEKISTVKTEEGETVYEMLEKLARSQQKLLTSSSAGDLLITDGKQGALAGTLSLGKNIKACSGRYDYRDRYSVYTGKCSIPGDDNNFGTNAAQTTGKSTDSGITRYRPLVILAEESLNNTQIKQRMDWENNVRAARSARITYTVTGWTDAQNALWKPFSTVRIIDAFIGIDQVMMIAGVRFVLDGGGMMTELSVTGLNAYTPNPTPEKIARKSATTGIVDEWLN